MEKPPPVYVFRIQTPKRSATVRLEGPCFVLGRGEPYRIFHDDPTLSREHLALVDTGDGYTVKDLGSRNGVLLNGKRLDRYGEAALSLGDTLVAGNTTVRLMLQEEAAADAAAARTTEEVTVDATGKSTAIPALPAAAEDHDLEGEVTSTLDRPAELDAEDLVNMEVTQVDLDEDEDDLEATQVPDDDEDLELLDEPAELTIDDAALEDDVDPVAAMAEAIEQASASEPPAAAEESSASGVALEELAADLGVTPDELEAVDEAELTDLDADEIELE